MLGGDGLAWLDGVTHEVGTGDCIVHLPGAHAHTLRAGPAGLDVLVLGERRPAELCELPRTGYGWLGDSWVRVGDGDSPWERDAAEGEPDFPPPSRTARQHRRRPRRGTAAVGLRLRHGVVASAATSASPRAPSRSVSSTSASTGDAVGTAALPLARRRRSSSCSTATASR